MRTLLSVAMSVVPLLGHAATLENRAVCTLVEGRQLTELLQYATDYEAAAANAGIKNYHVRVLVPRYAANVIPGRVIWAGVHPASEFQAVGEFYRSGDWAPKLRSLVSCTDISLWDVLD